MAPNRDATKASDGGASGAAFAHRPAAEGGGASQGGGADAYSRATARATVQAVPALLDAARIRPFMRLLDVACGPGYAAGAAGALGLDALGVDISDAMVAVARLRQQGASFEIGDAEDLRFADAAFQAVVCNFGVLHLPRPERAFAEAFRVLEPGGRYAFSQWRGPGASPFFDAVTPILNAALTEAGHAEVSPAIFRFSTEDEAVAALAAAGFEHVETRGAAIEYWAPEGDFFEILRSTAVRLPQAIEGLPLAAKEDLRARLNARMAAFVVDGAFHVGMPALIASARKPRV